MFHDESVGEKKLTLVVVKIVILKDGVRLKFAVDHSLCPPSVGLSRSVGRSVGRLVGRSSGWSDGRSVDKLIERLIDRHLIDPSVA